jgi:uncharacterized protein YdeI (YjbR/CyaY-like superfamily)
LAGLAEVVKRSSPIITNPSVNYLDLVEEALCFGWMDSTRKKMDAMHTAQRFSPRKANGQSSIKSVSDG